MVILIKILIKIFLISNLNYIFFFLKISGYNIVLNKQEYNIIYLFS